MRVISGSARGCVLQTAPGLGTRPTADKVKQALFNILMYDVQGKTVIDLFAGSGALGIEALSRGAHFAWFGEQDKQALGALEKNLEKTRLADCAKILRGDALQMLVQIDGKVDLVFLDPPYHQTLAQRAIQVIAKMDLLTDGGIIVAETAADEAIFDGFGDIKRYDIRKYGKIILNFYKKSID